MRRFLLLGALLLFPLVALAAEFSQTYQSTTFSQIRSNLSDGDPAALESCASVPAIPNPNLRPTLRVGVEFSSASGSVNLRIAKGTLDSNKAFHASGDITFATVSPVGTTTLHGNYLSASIPVDMAGANAAQVLIDKPSTGTVSIDAGVQ